MTFSFSEEAVNSVGDMAKQCNAKVVEKTSSANQWVRETAEAVIQWIKGLNAEKMSETVQWLKQNSAQFKESGEKSLQSVMQLTLNDIVEAIRNAAKKMCNATRNALGLIHEPCPCRAKAE